MNPFKITANGTNMGTFLALSASDAVGCYVRDAGYNSVQEAADAVSKSKDEFLAELTVEEMRYVETPGAKVTITRSTRSLGYGCTSTPETVRNANGSTSLTIARPDERRSGLTPRTLLDQREDALRSIGVTGGGSVSYRESLFVGGRRVAEHVSDWLPELQMLYQKHEGRYVSDSVTLTLCDEE